MKSKELESIHYSVLEYKRGALHNEVGTLAALIKNAYDEKLKEKAEKTKAVITTLNDMIDAFNKQNKTDFFSVKNSVVLIDTCSLEYDGISYKKEGILLFCDMIDIAIKEHGLLVETNDVDGSHYLTSVSVQKYEEHRRFLYDAAVQVKNAMNDFIMTKIFFDMNFNDKTEEEATNEAHTECNKICKQWRDSHGISEEDFKEWLFVEI